MAVIGYVWVGALEHNGGFQHDLLRRREVHRVFEDISPSVSTQSRPQLTEALDAIGPGDSLVVWRLDRLGSTTSGVLSLLELLGRRGVGVSSLAEDLDTAGDAGRSLLTTIAAFNELERCLARERAMAGAYTARSRGRVAGRPRALSDTNVDRVLVMREQGASVREIAEEIGTSRATVYRVLEQTSATVREDQERHAITVRIPGSLRGEPEGLPAD